MAFEPKTGHSMKLYYNSGTVSIPVWEEIGSLGDLSIPDLARGMAELKRRGTDWTKKIASLLQAVTVEFRMPHGVEKDEFDVIRAAFFAGTVYEYAIMSGDITASAENADNQGLRMPAYVEAFPWDQPLEDVSGHDIRLGLAYMMDGTTEVDPSWMEVAAS